VSPEIDVPRARRLALCRAGLLKPEWTGLPSRASGKGKRARDAALAVVRRFGYLQLDTVSIAGARSHAIVLLSRLRGMDPELGESLLRPGEPLFEYWGHEVSWIPLELYPALGFRRRGLRAHPWWGDIIGRYPDLARDIMRRIRDDGPLKSADLEGSDGGGWWKHKPAKKVVLALWSRGDLAVRERKNFLRTFDLTARVIPEDARRPRVSRERGMRELLLKALEGHGWAQTGTLGRTWRFLNLKPEMEARLGELVEAGVATRCTLRDGRRRTAGWIRVEDLELAERLTTLRPRGDRGVILSPFDPVLWDRRRVLDLFGFEQMLEIFKPAPQRKYGYYCLPVLAGERLAGRVDLKAERTAGRLRVLSKRPERGDRVDDVCACDTALATYAEAVRLKLC